MSENATSTQKTSAPASVQTNHTPLYIGAVLAIGAIIYFINGLTQPMTRILINLAEDEPLINSGDARLVPTQAHYYSDLLIGVERFASDNTAPALATLLLAIAIALIPQIKRAIALEVSRFRGTLPAIFFMLAGVVPSALSNNLNGWILHVQGVELGERSVATSEFLNFTGVFLFVGIALVFSVDGRIKEARFRAESQEQTAPVQPA